MNFLHRGGYAIFTILDRILPGDSQIRAREIMSRHVIAVGADVSVNDAIEIMLLHLGGGDIASLEKEAATEDDVPL